VWTPGRTVEYITPSKNKKYRAKIKNVEYNDKNNWRIVLNNEYVLSSANTKDAITLSDGTMARPFSLVEDTATPAATPRQGGGHRHNNDKYYKYKTKYLSLKAKYNKLLQKYDN
jgi:hypothetical protein